MRPVPSRRLLIGFLLLLTGGASALVLTASGRARTAKQTRPNIVVIESDDQTQASLRFMPNVQRLLVAQGTTFDNSFVTFSLCCPSRTTFLTGQYAHNHGVLGNRPPAGGYETFKAKNGSNTLQTWLRGAGYYTVLDGKYLNGYGKKDSAVPPGWSEWYGAVDLAFLGGALNENGKIVQLPQDESGYQTDVLSKIAQDVIRRRAPSAQPFFLWVTPHAPHTGGPRDPDDPQAFGTTKPPARYRDRFANEALPVTPSFNEADVGDKPSVVRNEPALTPEKVAAIKESYQQALEANLGIDDLVGAVVKQLAVSGELANTLIVYTSDNGFFHGEHRVPSGKVLVYEPSIRVPLVVRGPGVPRKTHLPQLVGNIDLAPTFVEAAGAKAGKAMDGRSLLALFRNVRYPWRSDLLLESGPSEGKKNDSLGEQSDAMLVRGPAGSRQFTAVRTSRYLYAEYADGERELYDLVHDPYELQNLAADPALAQPRAELARRLATLRSCKSTTCR